MQNNRLGCWQLNDDVYRMTIRFAMLYGLEWWALIRFRLNKLNMVENKNIGMNRCLSYEAWSKKS